MDFQAQPNPLVDSSLRTLAARLNVSESAVALCHRAFFIDLHIDTLIPPRLWSYDIFTDHSQQDNRWFFGHLDVPRLSRVGMDAAMWSITTNPFRTPTGRFATYQKNLARFSTQIDAHPQALYWIRKAADIRRHQGIGVLLSIQGGNALESAPDSFWQSFDDRLTRVTLVHLTNSVFGATNAPWHRFRSHKGLTAKGRELVQRLNHNRVFVDLAHIHPEGFWHALEVHEPHLPPIVTHTGVKAVAPHWRNIDDRQIRAIADRGGVVGVMVHAAYLRRKDGPKGIEMIAEHIEHLMNIGGTEVCGIGTDFDGAIIPPRGFRSGLMYPRLVQLLLDRGHSEAVITKILGENFHRSFARLRPH